MTMPPPANFRPRLLIVDDEPFNVQLLSRIFERSCEVVSAKNGHEALERLVQADFDVVLLDIMMPKLNGLDALKIIRQSADLSILPVILISAVDDKDDIRRGISLGANDYIPKPFDVDIVQARVNTQIRIKRLSDERRRLIVELQSANAMKARMMQVASHDLKNPINNIRMALAVLERQIPDSEGVKKMLRMADHSFDEMMAVINDFLSSSIARSSEIKVVREVVSLAEASAQVIEQYIMAAEQKQIRIDATEIHGEVFADPDRLRQILGNLLSNAIKYAPPGTTVTIFSETDGQRWRVYVLDQGSGINEEEQAFLFKPFSKSKISTQPTAGEESTGLGLWIVAEMLALMDGAYGFFNNDEDEGGACFWIELPGPPATIDNP